MSLFLPILLLGFAQAADQPISPAATQTTTANVEAAVVNPPNLTLPAQPKNAFVLPGRKIAPSDWQVMQDRTLCFTMRTYLFERRNGYAPEPVGMTTCQPASARQQKRAGEGVGPRPVPAN
jgi:hypothetical protein